MLAAAAPARETYVFSLDGVPVGTVELTLTPHPKDDTFRYVSTHWLARGEDGRAQRRSAAFRIRADAPMPSALWLWKRPESGCRAVVDELTGAKGRGCAEDDSQARYRGTLLGRAFVARYSDDDRLERLDLGVATFARSRGPVVPVLPPDRFGGGVPIVSVEGKASDEGLSRGALSLDPPGQTPFPDIALWSTREALALAERVRESFDDDAPGAVDFAEDARTGTKGGCVAHARRFEQLARAADGTPRAAIVYGFHATAGAAQAAAHAWVVVKTPEGALELDPTLGIPVSRRTHVAVGYRAPGLPLAGSRYLDVFLGKVRVVRRR